MRRAFIVLGSLLAVVLIALATLPWWLDVPLTVFGKKYGLSFGRYEQMGYGRFVLTDVRVERSGIDVRVARVEGETPLRWWWRRRSGTSGEWTVGTWSVDVTAEPSVSSTPKIVGWTTLRPVLDRVFEGLRTWLPPTTIGAGRVTWPGGQVEIADATWKMDRLLSSEVNFRDWRAAADVRWPTGGGLSVELRARNAPWSLSALSSDMSVVVTELTLFDQVATAKGRFGPTGWLPFEADAQAERWTLPAREVQLAPAYETVSGSIAVAWKEAALDFSIDAKATPVAGSNAPPLTADVRGSGDATQLRIERLQIDGPGLVANLARPVAIQRNGDLKTPETLFQVKADLAKMPWFTAQGSVDGKVDVMRQSSGQVKLRGTVTGQNMGVGTWSASSAQTEAELVWPLLTVSAGEVNLTDGERISFSGSYDLKTKRLGPTQARGDVSRTAIAQWVPSTLGFERLTFSATASGPWTELVHQGELSVRRPSYAQVVTSSLALTWKGSGEKLEAVSGQLNSGTTQINFGGACDRTSARVTSLSVVRDGVEQLRATVPATVVWSPSFRIQDLTVEGIAGALAVNFFTGDRGRIDLRARELKPDLWKDFVPMTGPAWAVHSAKIDGTWDRGPLTFSLQATGTMQLDDHREADVTVVASGDRTGFDLSQLEVTVGDNKVVTAIGKIPATLQLDPTWEVKIDRSAELKMDVVTAKDSYVWARLGEFTGLVLIDPQIRVNLFGSWRAPRGEATVEIKRIGWPKKEGKETLPSIEELRATLVGDGTAMSMHRFSATLAGQPVIAEARLPLPDDVTQNSAEELKRWAMTHLEARVRVVEADLAAVAPFAQTWIAPTGRLSVDLSLKPDLQWEGSLQLREAATRPLGPLGVLQGVEADLILKGRTLEVRRVEAKTGGQPVSVQGTAQLLEKGGWSLDLTMTGANLPLVRQTGLLVRGDVDLRAKTESAGVTRVTGKVTLRDSLFLADVRTFLPRGSLRSSPSRRPPYFSIDAEPFARWQLAVAVEGQRFLRLRTPVFNGIASARFRLQGTLAEPMSIGEALIDEGQVTLPFATLQSQQGNVSLTEVDPYDPQVSLIAVSRRLGYDLKLELSGSASSPNLIFSSSPPLGSEQVLRLVMAGEAPEKEVVYSGQQRAMRLGAYLGQSLAGQLGADTSRAERFSLTVGERVSQEGRETYALELPLDERFSIVGEYDEFDDYNVGLKWRAFRDRSKDPVVSREADAQPLENESKAEKPKP